MLKALSMKLILKVSAKSWKADMEISFYMKSLLAW
jgi:hypothetical protein